METKARELWNTMLKIEKVAEDLGYYANLSDTYGCWYEVVFRRLKANGRPDMTELGWLGIARTQNLSPITLSAHVPADIRQAVAGLL